ncbi:MAG: hypothetical protein IKM28_10485 [Lachnospiraceae bacterium]|nr:hypothetical protein [Lachnospiraceae bacterium]
MGKKDKKVEAFGLSLAAVLCLPQMLNLKGNGLAISNSWLTLLIWLALWGMLGKAISLCGQIKEAGKKKVAAWSSLAAGLLAFGFSLCLSLGVQLEAAGSVELGNGWMWISILVWTGVFALLIKAAWIWLDTVDIEKASIDTFSVQSAERGCTAIKQKILCGLNKAMEWWENLSEKKQLIMTAIVFLLAWLPVFLAVYPGFFVYDAQDELNQIQTRNFTTHHPLPHVVLLGGIILAVHKVTGSYNLGIASYTLLQMLLMSGVFSTVVSYMKKEGCSRWITGGSIVYFAFFPVIPMFVLCSAKDGIFSGACLLLLVVLLNMGKQRGRFFSSWKQLLFFGVTALVMGSFRHNGWYALFVFMPVLVVVMKGYRKKMLVLLVSVVAAWLCLNKGLEAALSARDPGSGEMLTVPIQQLSRVYQNEKDSLTEEQCGILYEILPEEALSRYSPKLSDGVKVDFQSHVFQQNPAKYIKLWWELGWTYSSLYLDAWLMTSYGFWYPDTVIDVYRGNQAFTYTYEDSSFFGYEVERPGERQSLLPWLDEIYRSLSLEITQQKLPVLSLLFSPGFLFWAYAFSAGYICHRKHYHLLLPFVLLLFIWLTVLLGPTCLPRYVLILWFALPLWCFLLWEAKSSPIP